jgi:hypothetical protein
MFQIQELPAEIARWTIDQSKPIVVVYKANSHGNSLFWATGIPQRELYTAA